MVADKRTEKFKIELPTGYCKGTQISKSFATHCFDKDNIGFIPTVPDTKFVVISLEKLQVVKGDIVAEKIIGEPVRVPGCYYLLNIQDRNYDDEIAKALWQLDARLSYLDLSLPESARRQIPVHCRRFLHDITHQAMILRHKAMWVSITLELVKKENYDEQNPVHKAMIKEFKEPTVGAEASPTCPICTKTVPKDNDDNIHTPCGVYCHAECVWRWPRPYEGSTS